MNKSFKFIVVLLIVFLIFGLSHAQKLVEAIVAIVNNDVITLSDYKANYDELYQTMRAQSQGEDFMAQFDLAKKYILDTMITNALLLQEAGKQGLNVEEQLKMSLDKIKEENEFESDAELIRAVEQ
ncbi:MAG: SurA N-terminal domain-containing protein, partial [candidate division Zixibacteria bacterium]|nr:SurA N-terminal domain-containing protein [candidate division Zixibacteria bacterium]